MIIISQDKRNIVNFSNITRISIMNPVEKGYKYSISVDTNNYESKSWDLGFYKTEERAKEILNEIICKHDEYAKIQNGAGSVFDIAILPKTYLMPKE